MEQDFICDYQCEQCIYGCFDTKIRKIQKKQNRNSKGKR